MHEDDPFEPATLVIACEGMAALHLQHETGEIIGRVNAFLGFNAIGRIRIVQKPVRSEAARPKPRPRPLSADEETQDRRRRWAAIEDDGLRASLERLGRTILGIEAQIALTHLSRFRDRDRGFLAIGLAPHMP